MNPYKTIKHGLQYHPSIFPDVYRVLEHVFIVLGNGYHLEKGELVCSSSERKVSITSEGLHWLAYDMLNCKYFAVYPIGSYADELKRNGDIYYRIYHYENLTPDWQHAARWFMWQLLSRNEAFFRDHYRALDKADPVFAGHSNYRYDNTFPTLRSVRRHLKDFCKTKKIGLSYEDARLFEVRMLLQLQKKKSK